MEDPAGGQTGTGDADLMDRIRELEEDLTRTQEELARITSTDDEAAQEATDNDGPPSDDPDGEMAYKLAELVAASVTKVLKGDVNQHSSTPITAPIMATVKLAAKYDSWDNENDYSFRTHLLDCIDPELHEAVSGIQDIGDHSLVTWIKLVQQWSILTAEKSHKIISEVNAFTLQQCPALDMSLGIQQLRPRIQALCDTRDYDPKLLYTFLESLHGAYPVDNKHHLEWWTMILDRILTPLKKAYKQCKEEKFLNGFDIELFLLRETREDGPCKGLDHKSILDTLLEYYMIAVNEEKWPATSGPQDSGSAPMSFGSSSVHHTTVETTLATKADVHALIQRLDNIGQRKPMGGFGDNQGGKVCWNCGSSGHLSNSPDCPKNQAHRAPTPQTSNRGFKKGQPKMTWKRIPPKDG
ncbi:unknown protein [Seminavis robusta]|uniref:Zinc knuckle domain-containing protein n=1 Tax=Seminavis robusta TaxID=568900 RepID=A0A9N8DJE3_9STRA|nr:unknown protein [Seminavis robusta]|eukprot:Sro114_g056430.1 n/a (411) ;mRNA; r:69248-70828